MGRNVHVLFLHGVGQHSPLSSLLRAYQALRSDLTSDEAPGPLADLIPDWRLAEFDDSASPQFLRLVSRYCGVQPVPDSVYLYEVNYSTLAGIIRANQPIDLTRLLIGFDLAVNFALQRLRLDLKRSGQTDALRRDRLIAKQVQKLSGLLVAATMPLLGLPAILLRQFTGNSVSAFTRFFEDIVTFALDKNGEQLISKHVDRTLKKIVESERFQRDSHDLPGGDSLIIAAHSLGSVVIHNFLLRHWAAGGPEVPRTLLTYGCPVGLICWVWQFLDFPRLQFTTDPAHFTGDEFFSWRPEPSPQHPLRPITWLNVINHLDPLATAFPVQHVNMAMREADIRQGLTSREIKHHFIRRGSVLSAHTDYVHDREGFLELLGRAAELIPDELPHPASYDPVQQRRSTLQFLLIARWALWLFGVGAILGYVSWLAAVYREPQPHALLAAWIYLWPPTTLAYLAFFQRLFFGAPTQRLRAESVKTLRWWDLRGFAYRIRLFLRLPPIRGRIIVRPVLSTLPAIASVAFPVLWWRLGGPLHAPVTVFLDHPYQLLGLIGLFMVYHTAFAFSEFTRQWRKILQIAGKPAGPLSDSPQSAPVPQPAPQPASQVWRTDL